MARTTLKSQAIIIAQLEAQVAELTTQVGVLMSALEESNQSKKLLQDEVELLKESYDAVEAQLIAAEAQVSRQQSGIPSSFQESYAVLVDERKELIAENQRLVESCIAAHQRCDALEAIVAAQPKTVPPAQPKKPAPKPQVPASELESQPVIQVTDTDRRIWAAFKALPREKRQSYYDFAHATVGHLGIHNIVAVREAYLAQQAA